MLDNGPVIMNIIVVVAFHKLRTFGYELILGHEKGRNKSKVKHDMVLRITSTGSIPSPHQLTGQNAQFDLTILIEHQQARKPARRSIRNSSCVEDDV